MERWELDARDTGHTATVFLGHGCFLFQVQSARTDEFVAVGGGNHELPELGDLIEASSEWIDWSRQRYVLGELEAKRREQRFSPETRRVLSTVSV